MLLLILSILLNAYLILSFRLLGDLRISTFQAIVFNYITCVFTGMLVNHGFSITSSTLRQPWFSWSVLMGAGFFAIFNILALTARKIGVAVASVANKLSLVIPFGFSLYLYHETAGWLRFTGVLLAMAGVYFTIKPGHAGAAAKAGRWQILLPVLLFFASGLLDTLIKYVEQAFVNNANRNEYLVTTFACAGGFGSLSLLAAVFSGRQRFDPRCIVAGIAIGIPNYFSIWALLGVLKQYPGNSSAILPINNMGILLCSALGAWWLFRERLAMANWMGIALSLAAIALIAYG